MHSVVNEKSERSEQKLQVKFGGFTTAGVKAENQDAFAALAGKGIVADSKGAVACLADGVSCSEHAQKASHMLVQQLIEDYFSCPDTWQVKTAISKILSSLNTWLYQHGDRGERVRSNAFVTTLAGLIIKSTTVHLVHVGDSRIYRYRKGVSRLELLTRDHTQKRGADTLLTRAMGMDSHLQVDYKQEDVEVGDIFIVTSDGVHDFVSPAEMRQAVTDVNNLEATAKLIVEHALASGSDDNATCLLCRVDNLPVASLEEVHQQITQLAIPPVMDIGMTIDGYQVIRVLHSGTRSHVYLVQHPEHDLPYVLKAPSHNFADDLSYLDGFVREQWIGLRVNSDSVMKTYPTPKNSRFLYLLMEYVEGKTLRQFMDDNGPVALDKMRTILNGAIKGIRVLQRMDMVHRDIKPENIMICSDERVKIIDFGTVKVNGLGDIKGIDLEEIPVGSVDYIAPEYVLGGDGNIQSDIFSLGVIAYEMITGKLPYAMSHIHRRLPEHSKEWVYTSIRERDKSLPIWIDAALKKAVHPQISQRHTALSEFSTDLQKPNRELIARYQKIPLIERNPVLTWQLVSAVLCVVIILQWVI